MPVEIPVVLGREFDRSVPVVESVLNIFREGGTVPFISRYRKEVTQNMDEIQLRAFEERWTYLKELEERKGTVLKTISELNKLTPELGKRIQDCLDKVELEELYLPYKPKRKTRASVAREKGLDCLAQAILEADDAATQLGLAESLKDQFKDVATLDEALQGASDILAEQVADTTELRDFVRKAYEQKGVFHSWVQDDFKAKRSKFEMYYDYRSPVATIPSHNMLAIRRGEAEGVLLFTIEADDAALVAELSKRVVPKPGTECGRFMAAAVEDAYNRLMKNSLIGLVRNARKQTADEDAIDNFAANLRNLLLLPPAGTRPVLAVDPGFRTGCKLAVLDRNGKFLENATIYPTEPRNDKTGAGRTVSALVLKHNVELISIGNGTASRETESFLREFLDSDAGQELERKLGRKPEVIVVNESGASVYSASPVAAEEFPDLDVTVRGAISIGHRLQDPLAELVKIEPKSLGVGQYQHDVDQNRLKKRLGDVVESCVNNVGVDLNTASGQLLSYVAGLNSRTAGSIIQHRNQNGSFHNRAELLKVNGIGPKAFEQSAGFLRIRGGDNPLDNSGVHPERYGVVEKMAAALKTDVVSLVGNAGLASAIRPEDFLDEERGIGLPTLQDIMEELARPGRDPRKEFRTASFKSDIREVKDLKPGMVLEGNVTNVANFGAFVDIGVHQDGLVHVSELAHRFVKDPLEVVHVGDVVKVKVLAVDLEQKRISLSIKQTTPAPARPAGPESRHGGNSRQPPGRPPQPRKPSLQDLLSKNRTRLR